MPRPYTPGMFGPAPANVRPGMWEKGEFKQEYFVGAHGYGQGHRGYVNGERHAPPSGACDEIFDAFDEESRARGDAAYQWDKDWFGGGDTQYRWRGFCYDDGRETFPCQQGPHENHEHDAPDPAVTWNPMCIAELPQEALDQAYAIFGGVDQEGDDDVSVRDVQIAWYGPKRNPDGSLVAGLDGKPIPAKERPIRDDFRQQSSKIVGASRKKILADLDGVPKETRAKIKALLVQEGVIVLDDGDEDAPAAALPENGG